MRMAELSRVSGVPVATIKYYLREGLLPAGERTSPNQAHYDESHVRRLKLVRGLVDTGGLSIAQVRKVLEAIDDRQPIHDMLGLAQRTMTPVEVAPGEPEWEWAMGHLRGLGERLDWTVKQDHPVTATLVGALCALRELGQEAVLENLDRYAAASAEIAEADLDSLDTLPDRESIVERAVVGTILGDTLLAALRRLAQQNVTTRRYGQREP